MNISMLLSFSFRRFHLLMVLIFTLLVFSYRANAQIAQPSDQRLTIDRIYASPEFYPTSFFGPAKWDRNGTSYTLLAPAQSLSEGQDIVRFDLPAGNSDIVLPSSMLIPENEESPLSVEDYFWSKNGKYILLYTNTARVWRENTRGDYWILHLEDSTLTKLGGPDAAPSTLMFAKFSPDETRVAYVREHNLYVERLDNHEISALTLDGNEDIINGTFDWVYEEELSLQDGFRWNDAGTHIAYWQLDASRVRDFYLLNTTDSLYSQVIPIQYPKVGEDNSLAKIGVVSVADGKSNWMNIPGDPGEHYLGELSWKEGAEEILIQQLNRSQDTNLVWLCQSSSGDCQVILQETDEAWLDLEHQLLWLEDGAYFSWISERDGWRHIYKVSQDGQEVSLLTPGEFDVIELLEINEEEEMIYFIASPENATQRYLYRQSYKKTSEPERLTPASQTGIHSYDLSPGAAYAIHTYTTMVKPQTTDLVKLPDHSSIKMLSENPALEKNLSSLPLATPEFFTLTTEEDVEMDAWIIRPPNMDSTKKYPVIFYAYSEPANQIVLDRYDYRNYLWHQMLAQLGYVVIAVDNRGTPAPKGRTWRKIIHKKIGILNPADQASAARVLLASPQIDEERVGIWGWSGGGTATLNGLFQYPDIYHVGVSVAPVSLQLFYDNIYQERYMGLLNEENVEAYIKGSPISHVQNVKGKLLLIHGTGDDNVHYQNSEVLINALIRLNIQFDMMAYPNRTHGIYEGYNTTRHLRTKMTEFFLENLPPGPR